MRWNLMDIMNNPKRLKTSALLRDQLIDQSKRLSSTSGRGGVLPVGLRTLVVLGRSRTELKWFRAGEFWRDPAESRGPPVCVSSSPYEYTLGLQRQGGMARVVTFRPNTPSRAHPISVSVEVCSLLSCGLRKVSLTEHQRAESGGGMEASGKSGRSRLARGLSAFRGPYCVSKGKSL